MGISDKELTNRFTYHPPKAGTQAARYLEIREEVHNTADFIIDNTPESREQSLAITKLEEACFWANAAIARNE